MSSILIPTVIEKKHGEERAYDIYSRLLKERIIFVGGGISQEIANTIVAQLLFLQKEDAEKDIQMYINCLGGSVHAGLAIIDTMRHIKPDVSTIAVGVAASMGAMLLAAGTKGKRFSLPNASMLLHQPVGGVEGQATDIEIEAKEIVRIKDLLMTYLAKWTGKSKSKVAKDADRNFWMTAKEALNYGLIDKIIK